MYIYQRRGAAPRNVLSGLGVDRYRPPVLENMDPATGRLVPTSRRPAPWGAANISLQNIDCRFYQNAPREVVARMSVPYTMEISLPGNTFVGTCWPNTECPESVHQGANHRDPWRISRCAEWKQQWEQEAAAIIADEEFRKNVTESVLNVSGITGVSRYMVRPAEFLEVVMAREAKERPIKVVAFIFLAASGGILTWKIVRKRMKKKAAERAAKRVDEAVEMVQDAEQLPE